MERLWALALPLSLVLSGCAAEPVLCGPSDVETISWVQEGYVDAIWPQVQVPPPGETGLTHDPGLGPDAYILLWGDRGGPWDVPLEQYPVTRWTAIPNGTLRALDDDWDLEFHPNRTVVTFQTSRTVEDDGSLVREMRHVLRSVSAANDTQQAQAIDDAVRNRTGKQYTLLVPGAPRIGHIWNEGNPRWELAGQDLYWVHVGPWTFAAHVNGIEIDRARGPDHHVDLQDRVWADPEALDPDHFQRLEEEPATIEAAIDWFQTLAAMTDAAPQDVRVAGAGQCTLPDGVGTLPDS